MTKEAFLNPHKEEDEGYLAAEAGCKLTENLYPCGTLRYEHWRHGWRIKSDEIRRAVVLGTGNGPEDKGYLAAAAGQSLAVNPYPFGTIRYEDWRRGWHVKGDELQRAIRLGRVNRR